MTVPNVRAAILSGFGGPRSLPGLQCWLDASALSGLVDADPVTTWPDLSGNSKDAAQATAGNKPLYKTAILNSLPIVRFDGVDDWMDTPAIPALDTPTVTFIMAFIPLPPAGGGRVLSGKYTAGVVGPGDSNGFAYNTTTQLLGYYRTTAGALNSAGATNDIVSGTPVVATAYADGSSLGPRLFLNGVLNGTATGAANGIATGHVLMSIGRNGNTGNHAQFDLAELIMCNVALSATLRLATERYLGRKWGIAI